MHETNFWKADLSGQDFTVISEASILYDGYREVVVHFEGVMFQEANLSNSNFEDVNLSPKDVLDVVFENKAYLIRDTTQSPEAEKAIKELFGNHSQKSNC